MRALCVCNSGAVRSVTLQRMLTKRGHQAIAVGAHDHFPDTLVMLAAWAEIIYFADEEVKEELIKKIQHWEKVYKQDVHYKHKLDAKHVVGPDDWKVPQHPDLVRIYRQQFGEQWT